MIQLHTGADQGLTIHCKENENPLNLSDFSQILLYLKQYSDTITEREGEVINTEEGEVYFPISSEECKDMSGKYSIELRGIKGGLRIHLGDDTIMFNYVIKIPNDTVQEE